MDRGQQVDFYWLGGEGGGRYFLKINFLNLKMLKINYLSSTGQEIYNLT